MKFTNVRVLPTNGIDVVWRKQTSPVFRFSASEGWTLTESERGVICEHNSRGEALLVPWSVIASCDVRDVFETGGASDYSFKRGDAAKVDDMTLTATVGEATKRGPGRPPKVA